MFKKDAKLSTVLAAPTLSASDKQQIVQELTKHIGQQDKEGVVKNFLATLAENNRLGVLEGVVEKFGILMGAYRGEVELTVTSAAVSRTLFFGHRALICLSFKYVTGFLCERSITPISQAAQSDYELALVVL